jgi:hypothetical protein
MSVQIIVSEILKKTETLTVYEMLRQINLHPFALRRMPYPRGELNKYINADKLKTIFGLSQKTTWATIHRMSQIEIYN